MLSLCLIAKDEAALLGACLESVRGVVDEMLVVDTGSTDGTQDVARAAGARVVERAWDDDFSAARNAALAASTGDWILVLDADERLASPDALLRALDDDDFDLGLIPLHNADRLDASDDEVLSGRARRGEALLLPRLFRRSPALRWEGVIHETPRAWLLAGPRTRALDCALIHLGNVPELRAEKKKNERNRDLLERRCVAHPDDAVGWSYLARERLEAGETDGCHDALEQGWAALIASRQAGGRPAWIALATLRLHQAIERGDDRVIDEVLAFAQGCEHPNLNLLAGLAAERVGDLDEAARRYAAAGRWEGVSTVELLPGAASHTAWHRLGIVRLRQGHAEAARSAFIQALSTSPESMASHLGLAEADLELGEASTALKRVEAFLHHEQADAWILAARACSQLGRLEDLGLTSREASARATAGLEAPHRRDQLMALIQERAIYSGRALPGSGPVGRLIDLLQRRPSEPGAEDPRGLEHVALNLVRLGRAEELAPLFERRADELLPGLADRVRRHLAANGVDLTDDGEPDFVFIGGAGRSGTTLFRTMLSSHPDIWCGPELKLVSAICELRAGWWRSMGADLAAAGVDEAVLDQAVRGFVTGLLQAVAPPGQRIAEKTPHDLLHMETLGRIYPQARFVHVVRDGRAVTASLLDQRWVDPSTGQPVWYCGSVEGASRYWAQVVQAIRSQAQHVPGRYLEVRYEALVTEPAGTMRRVLAFLGERWSERVLAPSRHGGPQSARESSTEAVAQPIATDAIERWRARLSPADLAELSPDAVGLLQRLGYSSAPEASSTARSASG